MKTTLEELLAFRTVVDTGSITAAAESLGQTVSGISRALSRLEEKLETTLLNRTTRRLVLTEEGIAFLNHARSILASVDEAEDQIAIRRQKPAGRLRVNAATPFMLHVIVPLVAEFRELYPEIELELNTDDILIDLLAQDTDIAIRIGTLRDSTLHARALPVSQRSILASPDYLEKFGVPKTAEELSNHCLIGFNQPEHLNQWPIRHTHGDSWQITPSIRASSGETVRQLALAGVGLVCISDFMTLADQRRGELVQVLKAETILVRQPINAVYYRNTQLSARIVCFLDFLIERMSRDTEK
ncbi:LysR family transcriptional regulator [Aquirhabdus parva]|uniref:LysR family transcriptional regulator n=1 Tax=Aquirhabdus parva TaxID=2283318 RepID=A0A345P5B2_9GAMM|nr:LysR family transcriptional regulator [Aquirhabdus parva]AXI02471.1 LysR family transcriptional regulator [Aquirhabdus parva]